MTHSSFKAQFDSLKKYFRGNWDTTMQAKVWAELKDLSDGFMFTISAALKRRQPNDPPDFKEFKRLADAARYQEFRKKATDAGATFLASPPNPLSNLKGRARLEALGVDLLINDILKKPKTGGMK